MPRDCQVGRSFCLLPAISSLRRRCDNRERKIEGNFHITDDATLLAGRKDENPLIVPNSLTGPDLLIGQHEVNRNKHVLRLLAEAMTELGKRKFPKAFAGPALPDEINISPRQLATLEAVATRDVTLAEAANMLSISLHTANQHIAAARKAFGARTTCGAVHRALLDGYFKLPATSTRADGS